MSFSYTCKIPEDIKARKNSETGKERPFSNNINSFNTIITSRIFEDYMLRNTELEYLFKEHAR